MNVTAADVYATEALNRLIANPKVCLLGFRAPDSVHDELVPLATLIGEAQAAALFAALSSAEPD